MENPLNFKVYKGKSALRLNLVRPKDYSLGFIFAELANLKEITADKQRNYDWENNKLGVKLGFADITSIIYALEYGDSCDLFHEFNGTTTSIKLQRSEGGNSAYFFKEDIALDQVESEQINTYLQTLNDEYANASVLRAKTSIINFHRFLKQYYQLKENQPRIFRI